LQAQAAVAQSAVWVRPKEQQQKLQEQEQEQELPQQASRVCQAQPVLLTEQQGSKTSLLPATAKVACG
jgi:hypothetical protein